MNSGKFALVVILCIGFGYFSLLSCKPKLKDVNPSDTKTLIALDISKKPFDTDLNWKKIIGFYQKMESEQKDQILIREESQKLYIQIQGKDYELTQQNFKEYLVKENNPLNMNKLKFVIDKKGYVPLCQIEDSWYEHQNFGQDRIEISQLTFPKITFKKEDPSFVSIKETDPSMAIDLFFGKGQLPLLTKDTANALKRVNQSLQEVGYHLVIKETYLPVSFITELYKEDPFLRNKLDLSGMELGSTVYVDLFNQKTNQMVEMGSMFLEISEQSKTGFKGGTSLERWHRSLLKEAMEKAGFKSFENYWWKFTF